MIEQIKAYTILEETEPDPRDYDIARFVPGQDTIEDVEFILDLPSMDIILNQKNFYSCAGHAYAMAKSISEYQKTHKWIDYDPYVLYGTRYDGEYAGEGMYLRQGVKVLKKEGAFLRRDFGKEAEMPELKAMVERFKKDHPQLVEQAKASCIEGYASLATTYHTPIKTALKAGMPVVISIDAWGGMGGTDGIVKKTHGSGRAGRHAVCLVGWRVIDGDTYWIIINSWGTDEGYKGLLFFDARRDIYNAFSISDVITPIKKKCKRVEFVIGSSEFTADGEVKAFETVPYIRNGRTYLPVRFVAENLGASVEWDAETGTATIRSEEAIITVSDRSNVITINGKETKMDVTPEIVSGRMMAPIRFIAQALNCAVGWNEKENKAVITAL